MAETKAPDLSRIRHEIATRLHLDWKQVRVGVGTHPGYGRVFPYNGMWVFTISPTWERDVEQKGLLNVLEFHVPMCARKMKKHSEGLDALWACVTAVYVPVGRHGGGGHTIQQVNYYVAELAGKFSGAPEPRIAALHCREYWMRKILEGK